MDELAWFCRRDQPAAAAVFTLVPRPGAYPAKKPALPRTAQGKMALRVVNRSLAFNTSEELEFIDITGMVQEIVAESSVDDGLVNIQTLHTTTAVIVNENEPLLIRDIKKRLRAFASRDLDYHHDDFEIRTVNMCDDECQNGHSHCKAVILPTSVTLNLFNNELQMGRWQRIFFVELDRARSRQVQVQILG